MSSKIAFLFPGQGSQYVNMGKSLYENIDECKNIIDKGQEILNMPIKEILFNGCEDVLKQTKNNQPCILLVSLACQKALELEGIEADYVTGLSLGEYSALVYGGALTFEDGLKLIKERALIMDSALDKDAGSMAAVLRLDRKKVKELLNKASEFGVIEGANYNCEGQVVVAGEIPAIKASVNIAKELGGKVVPLKVSGPFHTSLYEKASYKYYEKLKNVEIMPFKKTIYSNVKGIPYDKSDDIKELLRKQITTSVLFEESIKDMTEKGVDTFIEIGPGKTLSSFVKKINKSAKVYNVEDVASLRKTIDSIKVYS